MRPDVRGRVTRLARSRPRMCGVLSLREAAALVAARSRLMQALPAGRRDGRGRRPPRRRSLPLLADEVGIAAVNGPASVVISGRAGRDRGRRAARRAGPQDQAAAGQPRVPLAADGADAGRVPRGRGGPDLHAPTIPIVSTLDQSADLTDAGVLGAPRPRAGPVRDAVQALEAEGVRTFLELGPDGTLAALARTAWPPRTTRRSSCRPLRRDRAEAQTFTTRARPAPRARDRLDWAAVFAGTGARRVELPTYAFQRERYWPRPHAGWIGDVAAAGLGAADHPLLGAVARAGRRRRLLFTGRLALAAQPWLADHAVAGTVLLPGTALRGAGDPGRGRGRLRAARGADAGGAAGAARRAARVQVQVRVGAPDERRPPRRSASTPAAGTRVGPAVDPARDRRAGRVSRARAPRSDVRASGRRPGAEPVPVDGLLRRLRAGGLRLRSGVPGPAGGLAARRELFAEVALPDGRRRGRGRFGLHPALLDAALHAAAWASAGRTPVRARLPFAWSGVSLYAAGARRVAGPADRAGRGRGLARGRRRPGAPVASVDSLVAAPVSPDAVAGQRRPPRRRSSAPEWTAVPLPAAGSLGTAPCLGERRPRLSPVPDVLRGLATLAEAVPRHGLSRWSSLTGRPPSGDVADRRPHRRRCTARWRWCRTGWPQERLAGSRLVVVTRGAVPPSGGEDVTTWPRPRSGAWSLGAGGEPGAARAGRPGPGRRPRPAALARRCCVRASPSS